MGFVGRPPLFSGTAPRELARGAGIGVALIILFLLGALIVRSIPALAGPVSDLLDNMSHGSVPMTLATLVINAVGEELFFRDVARRALSDASSPTPSLIAQVSVYIAVTAAMGVPLLLASSVLIPSTTLHLVWSTGMTFVLPGLSSLARGTAHPATIPPRPSQ